MVFPLCSFILLLLIGTPSSSQPPRRKCATINPSPETLLEVNMTINALINDQGSSNRGAGKLIVTFPNAIDVHFHIINNGSGLENGNVTMKMVQTQVDLLNMDYAPANISFKLNSIDFTTNYDWYPSGSAESEKVQKMKETLHVGSTPRDLNIYVTYILGGILGFSTFPDDFDVAPLLDGVVITSTSIPEITEPGFDPSYGTVDNAFLMKALQDRAGKTPFNMGRTLTHEVGHWLGLYHTFQDGCDINNDYVDDTPAIRSPTDGCPVGRDSCTGPAYPGLDDIRNFMDYSEDECMRHFTKGQVTRMAEMWTAYRALFFLFRGDVFREDECMRHFTKGQVTRMAEMWTAYRAAPPIQRS